MGDHLEINIFTKGLGGKLLTLFVFKHKNNTNPHFGSMYVAIDMEKWFVVCLHTNRRGGGAKRDMFNCPVSAVSFPQSQLSPLAILFGLCYNNGRKLSFVR